MWRSALKDAGAFLKLIETPQVKHDIILGVFYFKNVSIVFMSIKFDKLV